MHGKTEMRRMTRVDRQGHELVAQKWNPLEGEMDEAPPRTWDAGWVAIRMVRAFEVLQTMPGRIGPPAYGSCWPAILREFSDFLEESVRMQRAGEVLAIRHPYSAQEVALADEALCWPIEHLRRAPKRADALQLWAMARARRRSLRRLLRQRSDRARRIAALRRVKPSDIEPNRVLSETNLRRYLGPALETVAISLAAAKVPIR
jgi:hypothetical protein